MSTVKEKSRHPALGYPPYGSPHSRLRNDMADKSSLLCRNSDRLDSHGLMAALGSGGNVGRKGLRASRARHSLSDPRREPIAIYHVSRYAPMLPLLYLLICFVCTTLEPPEPVSSTPVTRQMRTPSRPLHHARPVRTSQVLTSPGLRF